MRLRFINKFIYSIEIIKNKWVNIIYRILLMIIAFVWGPLTIINILARKKLYNSIIIRFLLISRIIFLGFIILILINIFAERLSTI